jgi:hypothetical protein
VCNSGFPRQNISPCYIELVLGAQYSTGHKNIFDRIHFWHNYNYDNNNFPVREKEIRFLESQLLASQAANSQLVRELALLRERELQLRRQRTVEGNEGIKINKDLQDLAGICYALSPQPPLS